MHAREIAIAALGMLVALAFSALLRRRPAAAGAIGAAAAEMGTIPATLVASARSGTVLSGTLEQAPPVAPATSAGADEAEAHRMFRRVRDVVADNPDDAARVLRGWIYQGD